MALLDKLKPTNKDDLEAKLDEKTLAYTVTQDAVNTCELKLNELHEQDADAKALIRAEADLAKAKADRDRALRTLDVATQKYKESQKAESKKQDKENIKTRDLALKRRVAAAKKLDNTIDTLQEIITEFNETDQILQNGQRQNVVSWAARGMYGKTKTKSLIYQALYVANIPGAAEHFGMKPNAEKMKSIVEQVKYANDTMKLENEHRANPSTDESKLKFTSEPDDVTETTCTQDPVKAPVDTRPITQVQPTEKQVTYGKKLPDQESTLLAPSVEGETYRA